MFSAVLSCPLQGLKVLDDAGPRPGSDEAAQDADSHPVKLGQDEGWEMAFLGDGAGVDGQVEVLYQVMQITQHLVAFQLFAITTSNQATG